MTLALALFVAGLLTILLPCILPLIPIVLGVSVTGQSKLRPLFVILGMLVSFVGFTLILQTVLRSFVDLADILRIATYYILVLFGFGFLTHRKDIQIVGALAGSFFFWDKGVDAVVIAAVLGVIAMEVGGKIASYIQQLGSDVQQGARSTLGNESPWTAFVIGLTLGLVWVPCAGPALSFALTLVRDQPGVQAALYLLCYGLGTAVPLLLIGYGGQAAVHGVRAISPYTGVIKQIAGGFLIATAIALQFHAFENLQVWLVENTSFGDIGTRIEDRLFGENSKQSMLMPVNSSGATSDNLPKLPKIARAPELSSSGPWHNSEPLKLADLKGKVVLVDFWTYSCINCIRTLPYIEGYATKYAGKPFVIIGVHTPEFTFEANPKNVEDAVKRHGLTYPIVQDNDYGTWNAFANHYWPAKYLIDADGYIRYTHFGEGDYDTTDMAIESLLKEIGVDTTSMPLAENPAQKQTGPISPETYVGARNWPSLANAQGDPMNKTVSYTAPASLLMNRFALVGDWKLIDNEQQALQSDSGEIRMHWQGGEINLVLGPGASTGPVTGDVMIDGKLVKTITIDHYDLYNLFTGDYGDHELTLKLKGKGVEAYAFTFGG